MRCRFCIPMDAPGLNFICRDSASVTADSSIIRCRANSTSRTRSSFSTTSRCPGTGYSSMPIWPSTTRVMKTTLVAEHHAADHDPGADQARIRLGPGECAWPRRSTRSASRKPSRSSARSPCSPSSRAQRCLAAEQAAHEYGNGLWCLRHAPARGPAGGDADVVSAHQRDHSPARVAQSADHASAGGAGRSGAAAAAGEVPERASVPTLSSAAGCFGWPGISPPPRSAAATSSTSAFISARSAAHLTMLQTAATALAPTGCSIGFSTRRLTWSDLTRLAKAAQYTVRRGQYPWRVVRRAAVRPDSSGGRCVVAPQEMQEYPSSSGWSARDP